MNKKFIFIALGIILIIGLGLSILLFFTYSVSGRIIDLANKEPLPNIKVNINGLTDETNKDGLFQIKNIKIYQRRTLKIEVPEDYEQLEPISLDYSERIITRDIELEPTFKTIVDRMNIAIKNVQHDYLWDYMHPDDQQYWESKENYTETFKKGAKIRTELGYSTPEYKIGENIRRLEIWKHSITDKEYHDVMEVPIEIKIIYKGKEQSTVDLQYYQKIDSIWRYFTYGDKEEIKKAIEAYEAYKKLGE